VRRPLPALAGHGGVLFDLDGTLYRGDQPLPGAAAFVAACRAAGLRVGFATNNALLERATIAARLQALGIAAAPRELVTAAEAVAGTLRAAGHARVALLGGPGLRDALERAGLEVLAPADVADPGGVALAVGLAPELRLRQIARAVRLVEAGAPVFATTRETRYPTDAGLDAGTGTILAALGAMVPFEPTLCGKPTAAFAARAAPLVERDGQPVLVVGDSLPADVPLAVVRGWESLLLLTGATAADEVPADAPPDYVERDLQSALARAFPGA
jgi:HAD superfamily hydrolase (TIGR01450 family)